MIFSTKLRDDERALFQRELDAFEPDHVFDAHAHLYSRSHSGPDSPAETRIATMSEPIGKEQI